MSSSRPFRAEFGGWCEYGDDPIRPGDEVRYDDDTLVHTNCPNPVTPTDIRDICPNCWCQHAGECA
ncbi:hypothetical protein BST43_15705 [Mycobacteroides saopaulense]|jgi:hypothetical protein|uniref:Uncharacterized protein n=1 Tax=Mycobacteroides saopaulense TaxID=1578165 RepID=A0A1X0J1W7_9MYCO|nr:hypothetical protein BST43_15705 [Mycobacteroides saopaulense]